MARKTAAQLDREIADALARPKVRHATRKPQTYFPVETTRDRHERAAFDLCRINTSQLRALSAAQLEKASQRIGVTYMLPKKSKMRHLLSSFISDLRTAKRTPTTEDDVYYAEWGHYPESFRASREAEGKGYSEEQLAKDVAHNRRVKSMYEDMADEKEREIWQAQTKAGCPIRDVEVVARDLAYQGERERAKQLRQEARGAPSSYKGRKPAIK